MDIIICRPGRGEIERMKDITVLNTSLYSILAESMVYNNQFSLKLNPSNIRSHIVVKWLGSRGSSFSKYCYTFTI